MAKEQKKKFRLYTHHFLYMPVGEKYKAGGKKLQLKTLGSAIFELCHLVGLGVVKAGKTAFKFAYSVCFHTGRICLLSAVKIAGKAKKEISQTGIFMAKRYEKALGQQFKSALVSFGLILLISGLGFGAVKLVAKGLELKGRVLGIVSEGGKNLMSAKDSLKQQQLDDAQNRFLLAYQSFNSSRKQLNNAGDLLNEILSIIPQKRDADKLIEAAALFSRSGVDMVEVFKDLDNLHIAADGISSPEPLKIVLGRLGVRITAIGINLKTASKNISEVDVKNVPAQYRDVFIDLKGQLDILRKSYQSFEEVYTLLDKLLIGNKNVLVLFENNSELRPTGGFLGTYGNFKITDGKISRMEISSIYDLDGQLKEKIIPPTPILNVNDRWYMRDSNWFVDFPASAKEAANFYEKEGGETPDLIIAMTPNLIIDLLKLTGPINMPNYGISLDSDNFVEIIQAVSTQSQGPLNNPKQVLADFFPVLLEKLSSLPDEQWPEVLVGLQQNLNSKQVALYSRDNTIQNILDEFHWSGKIMPTDRDYLAINTSNLGGTKSDLYIDQETSLKSSIDSQGFVTNELTITRTNHLPKLNNTANTSFLRVLVPPGSTLTSNTGFDYKNLDTKALGNGYKTDQQVHEWEKASVKDVVTGMVIGTEAGKTYFGNWLTLEGGETKTVKLSYRLPFKLRNIDRHSLLVQKQMGALPQKFTWSLDFSGRNLEWSNFSPLKLETNSLEASLTINQDHFMGLVLKK